MSEFLAMGGYAQFVWPAFMISILVLLGVTVLTMRSYRREQAMLASLEKKNDATAPAEY